MRRRCRTPCPASTASGARSSPRTRRARPAARRGRGASGSRSAIVLPIAATSGAATAVVLREAVIPAPDPAHVPDEQTPLAGTAVVSTRAGRRSRRSGLPWTVRVARSKTGFTCTTVGQVRDGVFGLTGLDGVFRRLPGELSDACGQGGTLTGARVARRRPRARTCARSSTAPPASGLRTATLTTAAGERPLTVGPGGTFVAVAARLPRGQRRGRDAGLRRRAQRASQLRRLAGHDCSTPPAGRRGSTDRYAMGTRWRCARLRTARPDRAARPRGRWPARRRRPPAWALRSSDREWVADARTFRPGDRGVAGARSLGLARSARADGRLGRRPHARTLRSVTLRGAGAPRS